MLNSNHFNSPYKPEELQQQLMHTARFMLKDITMLVGLKALQEAIRLREMPH